MNAPSEKFVNDARILVADVEELLKATAQHTGEKAVAARARLQAALQGAQDTVAVHAREVARNTDRYVHEHPWRAAGISTVAAAGIGLVVGLLIGRR